MSKIVVPKDGSKIQINNGVVKTPNNPIIGFIEGDGIGVDIWKASKRVFDAAVEKIYRGERKISWMEIYAGDKAKELYGDYLPEDTIDAIKEYKVAIKGPLTTPIGGGIRSLNVALRQKLDLFACVRPVRWFTGVPSPVKDPGALNIVIFRENTEDVYSGIEWENGSPEAKELIAFIRKHGKAVRDDASIGIKPVSTTGSKRLIRKAIEFAIANKKDSVTIVHKGNIMKFTEGYFKKWGYELAKEEFGNVTITEDEVYEKYNGKAPAGKIVIKDRIADSMFQQILTRPSEYCVLATTNLNGDYLSDASAAQVGGLGLAPGANMSNDHALFEATHGTAPKYAGKDVVNPSSVILSGVMMFNYLGWTEVGDAIIKGIEKTIAKQTVTYDIARLIGPQIKSIKCSEYGEEIIKNL